MDTINNKDKESEFQDYILFSSLQNTKFGLWVTLGLFLLASIINSFLFPDSKVNHYLMRFGLFVPIILLTLLAIHLKILHKWLRIIFKTLMVLSSLVIFYVGFTSDIREPGYEYYYTWTMLMIMGTFIFYRVRFKYIIAICIVIVIAFFMALVFNHTLRDQPDVLSFNLIFVIDICFLGFFITSYRDIITRKLYYRDIELSGKNEELNKEIGVRLIAENALIESEENYKGTLQSMPDWVHVVDRELRFLFMNTSFIEVNRQLGLETNVVGKHIEEVFPFIPQERVGQYEKVFKTGEVFIIEEIVKVNNTDFFTETRLIPIFKENRVAQLITIIRDIGKKKEIESLKLKNAEQKELLLREIHHRVKNNLAIVISLLDMQIRKNPNPVFISMARDIEFRIRSMSVIHEHLYKSNDLDRVSFNHYLESLATSIIRRFHKNIALVNNLENVDVKIENAMPLGLIVNEILMNACKYAFPDSLQGEITINLKAVDQSRDLFNLTIKDNGVGLPDGFSLEEQSSMGLLIIQLLVEQIKAQLIIRNHEGTSFSIIFQGIRSNKPNQ